MTTSQIVWGVGLILVLAVGAQALSGWLRIPSVIVLVPVGFLVGALSHGLDPAHLLGHDFQPVAELAVAIVLYTLLIRLDLRQLTGHTRRIVFRLIGIGVPVTMALGATAAALFVGMSAGAAVVTGAVLVTAGSTVIGPLLAFVRPAERLGHVLSWEGALIAPVGAVLGTIVFYGVLASTEAGIGAKIGEFALTLGVGIGAGIIGTAVLWLLLCKLVLPLTTGTGVQLAVVVGVSAPCDVLGHGTGLIAAIVMGVALANMRDFDVTARWPFLDNVTQIILDVLVLTISATVTPDSLKALVWPALGVVAVLVLVARPLVALLATRQTDLTRRERLFIGWMAPRGVIAVATAGAFAAPLAAVGEPGDSKILPVSLVVIVVTVLVYGLTATPVARWLGVLRAPRSRPLVVGGDSWVIDLGEALQTAGLDVLMWAGLQPQRERISRAALSLAPGDLLASITADRAEVSGITTILLLTAEDDFNALAASVLRYALSDRVYRVGPPASGIGVVAPYAVGDVLFSHALNRSTLAARYRAGATIVALPPSAELPSGHEVLFVVRADGLLEPATRHRQPMPRQGDTVVALTPVTDES